MKRIIFLISCFIISQFSWAEESLSQLNNQFASSLFSTQIGDDNTVFSPYGIFSTLSMVYLGARENTQSEFQSILHFSQSDSEFLRQFGNWQRRYFTEEKNSSLQLANALWINQELEINPDYQQMVENYFSSSAQKLDFSLSSNATETINLWIQEQTQGQIKNFLQTNDIDPMTQLVLTNAVHIKGDWKHPFDCKRTLSEPFYTPNELIFVEMMQQTSEIDYFENDSMQAVKIPFVTTCQQELEFIVLLPKDSENSSFSVEWNEQLQAAFKKEVVDLKLPKFCFSKRLDLNDSLTQLGLIDAFTSDANFSSISETQRLHLTKVLHQVDIAVNETGVKAAAATAATLGLTSILPSDQTPISFTVDRPFYFFIVHQPTNLVFFVGKTVKPNWNIGDEK